MVVETVKRAEPRININKYRDSVTCNIKIETEIDVYYGVKQAVK